MAFANDRTPGDDQLMDVAHGSAREQEIGRVEVRSQPLGIDGVPVEHKDVGRLTGRERAAVVFVGDRETSGLKRHSQHRRTVDVGHKCDALME